MLKQTWVASLLSIAVLGVTSLPTRAEQTSTQVTNQTSAVVGDYNQVNQYSIQVNVQQKNRGSWKAKDLQDSFQGVNQTAGAVGHGNQIEQISEQVNAQQQNDNPRLRGRKIGYFNHR
ncbi:hypothetical protein [Chroococcidiopsis sp. CCMEE 29]|jgi:hypothetical protein|uniref:hypothetical protein n=1 Tax=Chroococcidiopsis sp. CCMEE 29 TaxID=155894 RepID=UPI00202082A4|nr:hypothetical protein [Chroococcidiopsis sp. CCMEE 29]